ncbi:MAG: hypothetical protein V3T58_06130 [Candidatus Hydrothermarchaeales archaeon]
MRILLFMIILVFLVSLPIVGACPEVEFDKYPGWVERFPGNVNQNDATVVEEFDVTVTKVFPGDAIYIEVLKHGNVYEEGSASKGYDGIFKQPDIWVEVYSSDPNNNRANISIYTPQQANISVNLTNIDILRTISGRTQLFPNEEVQLDFTINNTGELPAKEVSVSSEFGEFQILGTDVRNTSLCQGSTYDFKYRLRSPNVRKIFNYTLYLKVEYSDENIQLARTNRYIKYYPIEVEIIPAVLEIERKASNWTPASTTSEITFEIILNNIGKSTVYNIEWSDTPPPVFLVTQGTTSWTGNILEGSRKWFYYRVVSGDPIICRDISTATYQDRFGNEYISFSNDTTAKFSPYPVVEREMAEASVYLDPDKELTFGTKTMRIGETANVSLKIKNKGNAIARSLVVNDTSGLILNGTNRWEGDLKPGEEVSFGYTFKLDNKDVNMSTEMRYLDVDMDAFNASRVLEEATPNYCSRKLKNVSHSVSTDINILYPDITVLVPSDIEVLSDFEFEYNVSVESNGTDAVYDLFLYIDTSSLTTAPIRFGGAILKGQPLYYIKELRQNESANFTLIMRAPLVENKSTFTILAQANYTDFYGETATINASTNLTVIRPKPAYVIIAVEEKELKFTIGGANETGIGEYGEAFIILKSTGYAALENVTLHLSLPPGLELFSNDTRWEGRYEAQLKKQNQTWYGFVENLTWSGDLGVMEEKKMELLIRGAKAGIYEIPYSVNFDGRIISGSLGLKVKGAILEIKKLVEKQEITVGEELDISVAVKNIGEDAAMKVEITDYPPKNFEIAGDTAKSIEEFKPGEEVFLNYSVRSLTAGGYSLGAAKVKWVDRLGNEYSTESEEPQIQVKIKKPPPPVLPGVTPETPAATPTPTLPTPTETPLPEAQLSRKELLATTIFAILILGIIIKMLTLSRPASEE